MTNSPEKGIDMDKEAQQIIAFGVMVLFICWGLGSCVKTIDEVKHKVAQHG